MTYFHTLQKRCELEFFNETCLYVCLFVIVSVSNFGAKHVLETHKFVNTFCIWPCIEVLCIPGPNLVIPVRTDGNYRADKPGLTQTRTYSQPGR